MKPNDLENFVALIRVLDVEHYMRDYSEDRVHLFWSALEEFDFEVVAAAFTMHIKNPVSGRFYPKVGDIIANIEVILGSSSSLAWDAVKQAISESGKYRSVIFDDPRIHVAIERMGGWIRLCEEMDERNIEAKKQEFCNQYTAAAEAQEWPRVLIGQHEQDRKITGIGTKLPPAVYGDMLAAKAVFKGQLPAPKNNLLLSSN